MLYQIRQSTVKDFPWNEDEELYFSTFHSRLTDYENSKIILHRLSNGSIEPYFDNYPLGKIKLRGREHHMQVFKSIYKWEDISGNVETFVERIDDVIKYMRKYCTY